MFQKFWDTENKYVDGFLKEYDHWLLEVSYLQHTLGCYIIFAKRKVEQFSQLNPEELDSLPKVMHDIESALSQLPNFKPDRFNYLQLGNNLKQFHFHGIPRYVGNREFANQTWDDPTYGHPPVWKGEEVDLRLVRQLRDVIGSELR